MMERTILILGAGVMQLPSIRAARRLGLRVVVADANPEAPAISEADEFLRVDLKDHETMAAEALSVRERGGLDAVFTAGTDFSATVAYVCERLGLAGTSWEASLDATDKFRMRRALREAGVSVPDFAVLTRERLEADGCASVSDTVALPVVVKPVDSMGARGVVRADGWDEAAAFAREAVEFSRSGRVLVEGYVDGPEFSLDAIVYGTDIQITGFADRHIAFPPYFIEMGHTLPTNATPEVRSAVEEEFRRAVRALRLGPGAAKGDVKFSSRGPVVGEVAARLSGGYMSGWTYPLATGVPLSEIGIRVALGEVPPRVRPAWDRTSAERAVISIPGRLAEVRGVDNARAITAVEEVFVLRDRGEAVRFPRNNVEKVANVIAVAADRRSASDAAAAAVRAIEPILWPANPRTDVFLFAGGEAARSLPPEYRNWAFPRLAEERDETDAWRKLLAGRRSRSVSVTLPAAMMENDDRDWAYRSVREIVASLQADPGLAVTVQESVVRPDGPLARILVRAIAKGGAQGARYVVDSLTTG